MNAVGYPLYVNGQLLPGATQVTHVPPTSGLGSYYLNPNAPAGLGAYVQYPVRGLGQGGAAVGVGLGIVLLGVLLGGAGWYAGKAMAPTKQSEGSYKIAGALSNLLLPGYGLGLVGIVSLSNKQGRQSG